jgi:hypothetical protein
VAVRDNRLGGGVGELSRRRFEDVPVHVAAFPCRHHVRPGRRGICDRAREYPVAGPYCGPKRLQHPEVGLLELHCQRLVDPDQSRLLVVYTASPGSESYERMRLLSVVGGQRIHGDS